MLHTNAQRRSGGQKTLQPLDGSECDLTALATELDQRIATAFPADGRAGRPSRPSAESVRRGVLVRCSQRQGYTRSEVIGQLATLGWPSDPKTYRRWEAAVRKLERAEGRTPPAFDAHTAQTLAYARRRRVEYFEQHPFQRKILRARAAARITRRPGQDVDERVAELVFSDPNYCEAVSQASLRTAREADAIAEFTGKDRPGWAWDIASNYLRAIRYDIFAGLARMQPRDRPIVKRAPADLLRENELKELEKKQRKEDRGRVSSEGRWAIKGAERERFASGGKRDARRRASM